MLHVRPESESDWLVVGDILRLAFDRPDEARLVQALRGIEPCISLVAEDLGAVVGHIFFSPVEVRADAGAWQAMGLGPVAVSPTWRHAGIGAALVTAGLEACRDAGHAVVFVLGAPQYYKRFGFRPAADAGIRWEHTVPREAFMVVELAPGALAGRKGVVHYRPEFSEV